MKKIITKVAEWLKAWHAKRKFAKCQRMAAQMLASVKAQYPGCEGAMNSDIWPPTSGTTTGFLVKGKTTILWGTDGVLSSPYPSGGGFYTVTNMTQKPIFDRTKLPNGTGLTTSDVFITDGTTWEVTVRDDSTMTPPTLNSTVVLVDVGGFVGTKGLVYTVRVVDPDYSTALKKEGERKLVCDSLLLIDNQTGSAQTAR